MVDWTIRPGGPGDVAAVLALWRIADAVPTSTDTAAALAGLLARDPGALLVATAGPDIVAR